MKIASLDSDNIRVTVDNSKNLKFGGELQSVW